MTMTAPVTGFSLATLARLVALPLPSAAPATAQQRSPDVVVFSSAPFRLLSDLASAGLQQLSALLPALEQALQGDSAASLGHLAKAAGAAARQVGEGHVALLAEGPERVSAALRGEIPALPQTETRQTLRAIARQVGTLPDADPLPDARTSETLRAVARQIGMAERPTDRSVPDPDATPIQRWLGEAQSVLRGTGDALDRAEQKLTAQPAASTPDAPNPDAPTSWALGQIAAAQAQVTVAVGSLGRTMREPRRAQALAAGSSRLPIDQLAGATSMIGTVLILAILWLAGGVWSLVTGVAGLLALGWWVLRISRASSGVRLDARR